MSGRSKFSWKWIAGTVVLAAFFHVAAIYAFPSFITFRTLHGLYGNGFVDNHLYFGGVKLAPKDIVPLDNPDNMSSFAIYDVSEHPVRIHAIVPRQSPYWSLSLTAYNTDSFFTVNDRDAEGDDVTVVIKNPETAYSPKPGEQVVDAPTDKGIVLFRMHLPNREDEESAKALGEIQRQATLEVVGASSADGN